MKNSFVSLFLALVLCFSLIAPAFAANESNNLGVTFGASLDHNTLYVSSEDQTVTMTLSSNSAVTLDGLGCRIIHDSALTVTNITSAVLDISASSFNAATGLLSCGTSDAENATAKDLFSVVFTIPANTPAGTYAITVSELELTKDYSGDIWEETATASAVLTITDPNSGGSEADYQAELSASSASVTEGGLVYITVDVTPQFAAAELTLTYPNDLVKFVDTSSTLNGAEVSAANGTLTLADYGDVQSSYVLVFEALAAGNALFSLESAAFSTAADAVKEDLSSAGITTSDITVTINKCAYTVSLPDIFSGVGSVVEGADYTFWPAATDAAYYDYTYSATMNGVSASVIDNGNGTYTIKNVTGPLVITGTQTAKVFTITFNTSTGVQLPNGGAITYGTDYTFTMPATEHYAFSITSAVYAGGANVPYSLDSGSVTISGANITDNITITIDQVRADATVTVEGSGAGDATGYTSYATPGTAYTLTVHEDTLYSYTVSATVNGSPVELTKGTGTYTIAGTAVQAGAIQFTIDKTLKVTIQISEYIPLNNTSVWLIKNEVAKLSDQTYTCDSAAMFWSDKYNAYCTLVIAENKPSAENMTFALISGGATSVDYGMDVNNSGTKDANDAQLAYNIYNGLYAAFDGDATVEKFLRADVNFDGLVSTGDAAAIIAEILG